MNLQLPSFGFRQVGCSFSIQMNVYCCHELEEEICSAPASSYHSAVLTCALLFDVVSSVWLVTPLALRVASSLADGFSQSSICKGFYRFCSETSIKEVVTRSQLEMSLLLLSCMMGQPVDVKCSKLCGTPQLHCIACIFQRLWIGHPAPRITKCLGTNFH